jgi:hypothetical protein
MPKKAHVRMPSKGEILRILAENKSEFDYRILYQYR